MSAGHYLQLFQVCSFIETSKHHQKAVLKLLEIDLQVACMIFSLSAKTPSSALVIYSNKQHSCIKAMLRSNFSSWISVQMQCSSGSDTRDYKHNKEMWRECTTPFLGQGLKTFTFHQADDHSIFCWPLGQKTFECNQPISENNLQVNVFRRMT